HATPAGHLAGEATSRLGAEGAARRRAEKDHRVLRIHARRTRRQALVACAGSPAFTPTGIRRHPSTGRSSTVSASTWCVAVPTVREHGYRTTAASASRI